MTEKEVLELLKKFGAIITDTHVCLTEKEDGWYHSDGYVAKDNATKHPWEATPLYQSMADMWFRYDIEVVAGPATGGSAQRTVQIARLCGGCVVGVAVIANRGEVTSQ